MAKVVVSSRVKKISETTSGSNKYKSYSLEIKDYYARTELTTGDIWLQIWIMEKKNYKKSKGWWIWTQSRENEWNKEWQSIKNKIKSNKW